MTDAPSTSNAKNRRLFPRRRWKWLLALGLLFLAVIAAAPTLAALFFLDPLLSRASREVKGQLRAAKASFGWFSPVELHKLEGHDPDGQLVFSAEKLQTEKSLWQLVTGQSIGSLHIDTSTVHVITRQGGSNVEDFLEPLLTRPREKKPLEIGWHLKDTRIEFHSGDRDASAPESIVEIPVLSGRFQRNERQAWEAKGQLTISAQEQSGSLSLETRASGIQGGEPADLRSGTLHLSAHLDDVPLVGLQPIVRRFTSDVIVNGTAHGDVTAQLEKGQASVHWNRLGATKSQIFITALSSQRPVTLDRFESNGQMSWSGDEVHVDSSVLTDFGTAEVQVTSLAAGDSAALLRILSAGNLDIAANVDLARLAQALPDRMGLRDDVTITSGSVSFQLHSEPQQAETLWTASLTTSDLAGQRGATPLVWPEPIRADLKARWANGRLAVDELECQSEFLTAHLQGTADNAEVQLSGDLQRLAERMQQFFDLPSGFAGKLDGRIHYVRRPPELVFDGQITTTDFIWNVSEQTQLHEPVMMLTGQATLRQDAELRLGEISTASLHLVAGDDALRLDLKRPLELQKKNPVVPLALTLKGNLAQWKTRAQPFVDLEAWNVSGLCDATGDVSLAESIVDVAKLQGEIHDLVVGGDGISIREPRVTIDVTGQWNGETKKWTSTRSDIASSTLAASGNDVALSFGQHPVATGRFMVRADLTRLQNWFPSDKPPRQRLRLAGEFIGDAYLDLESETTLIQLDGGVEGFEIAQPGPQSVTTTVANAPNQWKALWSEKEAKFNATARWRSEGKLLLHSASLSGEGWTISGHGEVTGVPQNPVIAMEGAADYDWQALAPRLQQSAGESLAIVGERHDPISVRGPLVSSGVGLVSPELKADGAFGWESARFQGIVVGAGEMQAALADSVLKFSMLNVPVSQGTLSLAPQIDLRQAPARLEIPPGTVLKDIQITPAMCRTWLKYALPALADVPKAEGSFDVQFDEVTVPLDQPQTATVRGAIVMHQATLGAGPLTEVLASVSQALAGLGNRRLPLGERVAGTWVEVPAQVVAFEMKDGRVVHRDLQMNVGDLVVHTSGSVGVDQTFELVVEIPVPESTNPNARMARFAGRTYRFPLRGKLGEKVDASKILSEIAKQSAGAAAETLLQEGLKRLFQDQ